MLTTPLSPVCHIHKDGPAGVRIRKAYRLANRFSICLIFFLLPLATSLNSLQLISITTGLVVYVLLVELWGMSCPTESFFGEKKDSQCKYVARIRGSHRDLKKVGKCEGLEGRGEKCTLI